MLQVKKLDVKRLVIEDSPVVLPDPDHIDRFLSEHDLPGVDPEVEGIVDRINGLRRRFHTMADETLSEHGLAEGEWKVISSLRLQPPPYRRSAGQLARRYRTFRPER